MSDVDAKNAGENLNLATIHHLAEFGLMIDIYGSSRGRCSCEGGWLSD